MGYGYRAHRLVCDQCGGCTGVRKRTCPYRVLSDSLAGPRRLLPYCQPPALCARCYSELGGKSQVHGERCRAGAQAAQKHADDIEAQLDAGELLPVTAWGDSHPKVPTGRVGVCYRGRKAKAYRLIHEDDYEFRAPLSAAATEEWRDHP